MLYLVGTQHCSTGGRAFFQAIIGAVGLGLNFLGARKQAKAEAAQLNERARVAEANAELVDEQIGDAVFRGRRQQQEVIERGKQVVGAQRAGMGAANLDLSFGTPLDLIYETTTQFMRDAEQVGRNTMNEVRDLEREKLNFGSEAASSRIAARSVNRAGTISALGSTLSGASRLYAQIM